MRAYIEQLLQVPSTDPDEARRKRLLNILLLGTLVAALLGLLSIIIDAIQNPQTEFTRETQILLGGIIAVTLGIFAIYQLNRRFSGRFAALLFLLLLTILFPFTDSADQIVSGRSLFLFTLPIAISSLILVPQASFLFADRLQKIEVLYVQKVRQFSNNYPAIVYFVPAVLRMN